MQYDNTNRGTLGRNQNRKSDKHPEYKGKLNVEGKEYWLAGWIKEGEHGKFFSLEVTEKVTEKETKKPAKKVEFQDDDLSDAPF
jgi:hypothetical protein